MRADRLVATLLVLQARGRVTAASLAAELEVSERTARRDLESLAVAGIPVYSQPGRNGGWSLVGGARTDLSGLTAGEARALLLLTGPSASTPELRSALRKLIGALPATFRAEAERAASAVMVDPTRWDRTRPEAPEHLGLLQQAVIDGAQLRVHYARPDQAPSERVVDPLGLVAKRDTWYLVARTPAGRRTFRVDRIAAAEPTGVRTERPSDFDLRATWQEALDQIDDLRLPLTATLRVDPGVVRSLRVVLTTPVEVRGPTGDGRVEVAVRSYNARVLGAQLAGFGGLVELVGPEEVRDELRRLARELAACYLSQPPAGRPAKARPAGAPSKATPEAERRAPG